MVKKVKMPRRDPKTGQFKKATKRGKRKKASAAPQTDWTGPDLFDMQRNAAGEFVSGRKLRAFEYDDAMQIIGMSDRWQKEIEDLDEVLETWEQLAAVDNTGFAEWIKAQRMELRQLEREALRLQDRGQNKDAYAEVEEPEGPLFYNSANIDAMDVTGLEGREASSLALLLKQWNPNAKHVYKRYKGKRVLTSSVRRIDLNHPIVAGLPGRDDIISAAKATGEWTTKGYLEREDSSPKRMTSAKTSRQASRRKKAQNNSSARL